MSELKEKVSPNLEDFIGEDELLNYLGLKKSQLYGLRRERLFPFINVARGVRVYFLPAVVEWLLENKRVLNKG